MSSGLNHSNTNSTASLPASQPSRKRKIQHLGDPTTHKAESPYKRRNILPKGLPKFDTSDLVTFIIVTPSATDPLVTFETRFTLHKEVATHYIAPFRAAFNNLFFLEGQTQTYTIESTTPHAFRLLTQWLYRQSISLSCIPEKDPDKSPTCECMPWSALSSARKEQQSRVCDRDDGEDMALFDLYILADRYLIPRLKSYVLAKLNQVTLRTHMLPSATVWDDMYSKTEGDSPLRAYAVREVVKWTLEEGLSMKEVKELMLDYPTEMVVDVCTETVVMLRGAAMKLRTLQSLERERMPPVVEIRI